MNLTEAARRRRLYRVALKAELAARGLKRLPAPEPGAPVDLFTGAAGTGKTHAALAALARAGAGVVTLYAAPDLAKAAEARRSYEESSGAVPSLLWRGRGAERPDAPGETMCARAKLAAAYAERGGSPRRDLCPSCPFAAACAYLRQERDAQALAEGEAGLVLFAAHAATVSSSGGRPAADFVVLDEDIRGAAWSGRTGINRKAFRLTPDAFARAPEDITEKGRAALAFAAEHGPRLLAGAWEAFETAPNAPAPALVQLAPPEEWATLARALDLMSAPPSVSLLQDDAQIIAALEAADKTRIPFARLAQLVRRIAERLKDRPEEAALAGVAFETGQDKASGAEWSRVVLGSFSRPRIADAAPILALDATGDPEIWRRILGRAPERLTHRHIPIERHADIIQLARRTLPKSAFRLASESGEQEEDQDVLAQIHEILNPIGKAAAPGKICVIAQKDVKHALGLQKLPWIEALHFGALRGRNAAESCVAGVVIGRPQPSCFDLDLMAGALAALTGEAFAPAGEYVRRPRARRMRDGSSSIETTTVHPHPLGDALLRQIREAELTQAIDRLRLTRPASPDAPRKKIYVLCSIPLDMTVDAVATWKELQGRSRLQEAIRAVLESGKRVLRLSARGLAEDAPGVFATEKAAKRWIEKGGLDELRESDAGFGNEAPLSHRGLYSKEGLHSAVTLIELRRVGERGSHATRALVFAPADQARDIVEAEFGPLLSLKILAEWSDPASPPEIEMEDSASLDEGTVFPEEDWRAAPLCDAQSIASWENRFRIWDGFGSR